MLGGATLLSCCQVGIPEKANLQHTADLHSPNSPDRMADLLPFVFWRNPKKGIPVLWSIELKADTYGTGARFKIRCDEIGPSVGSGKGRRLRGEYSLVCLGGIPRHRLLAERSARQG
jgi:hypothetical protein